MGSEQYADSSSFETFFSAVGNFLVMFSASAAIGIAFALISALISFNEVRFCKHANAKVARENSQHFMTPPLFYP